MGNRRSLKKMRAKAYTAPGTVKYTGKIDAEARVRYIEYNDKKFVVEDIKDLDDIKIKDNENVNWLDIVGLSNIDLINNIGSKFNIHPLVLEDITNISQRPKIDAGEEYIFIISKEFRYNKNTHEIDISHIGFFMGDNLLISFRERENHLFEDIKKRLESSKLARRSKMDFLLYAFMDILVDSYFLALEDLDEEVDILEDELFESPSKKLLNKLYDIKKEMLHIRNIMWPMRNIISTLKLNEFDMIDDNIIIYINDLNDHIIQLIEIIESYRDVMSGMLDTYLSSIGNKTNDVMKVLTIFSTIFIPLTFLTGLYGTNFPKIPFFEIKNSYQIFLGINAATVIATLIYLKKKDWL